jgi:hypothetical protein
MVRRKLAKRAVLPARYTLTIEWLEEDRRWIAPTGSRGRSPRCGFPIGLPGIPQQIC